MLHEALARAELARGRRAAAENAAQRALDLAQRAGWEAGRWRLHALWGRIQEKKGDAAAADAAFAEGARRLASVRQGLTPELRSSFDGLPAVRDVESRETARPTMAAR